MKFFPKSLSLLLLLSVMFTACLTDDNNSSSLEGDLQVLNSLKTDIETLASSSVCNDDSECRYIAFGSKPCGGPWSYLLYSTSIDTIDLQSRVTQYNQLEAIFNAEWGIGSDCALAQEPTDVICENSACVAVF